MRLPRFDSSGLGRARLGVGRLLLPASSRHRGRLHRGSGRCGGGCSRRPRPPPEIIDTPHIVSHCRTGRLRLPGWTVARSLRSSTDVIQRQDHERPGRAGRSCLSGSAGLAPGHGAAAPCGTLRSGRAVPGARSASGCLTLERGGPRMEGDRTNVPGGSPTSRRGRPLVLRDGPADYISVDRGSDRPRRGSQG